MVATNGRPVTVFGGTGFQSRKSWPALMAFRGPEAKGASLKATEQPIDLSTAAGKCFLDMLGVFAEFETNLRKERQMEGIAKAKVAGVYKGRPPSIDIARVAALKAEGWGPSQIARKMNISRASVYRALEA